MNIQYSTLNFLCSSGGDFKIKEIVLHCWSETSHCVKFICLLHGKIMAVLCFCASVAVLFAAGKLIRCGNFGLPQRHRSTEKTPETYSFHGWSETTPRLYFSRSAISSLNFLAKSFATSYPASAWRIMPIPGSLRNTRLSLAAASGVPSATITIPA